MDRYTVLVDAGYLLSQSVQILSAKSSKARRDIQISDAQGLIGKIIQKATESLGNDRLLRVYWYDGVSGKLSTDQKILALLPDVQLRQGMINSAGAQKGVDSKIVADLIELAGNHAISDAMLVTGDGDLAIGIELAQRKGVRVAVMGVEEVTVGVLHNQSFEITSIADRVVRVGRADIETFLKYSPSPPAVASGASPPASAKPASSVAVPSALPPAPVAATTPAAVLQGYVEGFIASSTPPLSASVISSTGAIDHETDRKLLHAVLKEIGRALNGKEKTIVRNHFRAKVKAGSP